MHFHTSQGPAKMHSLTRSTFYLQFTHFFSAVIARNLIVQPVPIKALLLLSGCYQQNFFVTLYCIFFFFETIITTSLYTEFWTKQAAFLTQPNCSSIAYFVCFVQFSE